MKPQTTETIKKTLFVIIIAFVITLRIYYGVGADSVSEVVRI